MEKSKLKTSSQEVFSSSVDVNLLITSMFFLVKMCEDLHPMEVKKEFAIMKKITEQPGKVTEDEILYAEKCLNKWGKSLKNFTGKLVIIELWRKFFAGSKNATETKLKKTMRLHHKACKY